MSTWTATPAAAAAAPAVTPEDVTVAACWGYTPAAWLQLSPAARADFRDRIVYAPYRRTVTA